MEPFQGWSVRKREIVGFNEKSIIHIKNPDGIVDCLIFWLGKTSTVSLDLFSSTAILFFQSWDFSQGENESLDLFKVLFSGTYNFSSSKLLILQTVTVLHCSCDGFEQNVFCSNSISPFPYWTGGFVNMIDLQNFTLMEFKMKSCFRQKTSLLAIKVSRALLRSEIGSRRRNWKFREKHFWNPNSELLLHSSYSFWPELSTRKKCENIKRVRNYNLNVTKVRDSNFKNAIPGIFNFTVGILIWNPF